MSDETAYASGREIWTMIQDGQHTHDSELLVWRVDKYAPKGEITAYSKVPGIAYGIAFHKCGARCPWELRCLKGEDEDEAVYASMGEAMKAADAREADERKGAGTL
jgi:hypothetical protein